MMTGTDPKDLGGRMAAIDRVLVVCSGADDDQPLLEVALGLAKAWQAELCLLATVEPPSEIDRLARATALSAEEIEQRLLAETRARIEDLAARTAPGLRPKIDVRMGKSFVEIIGQVTARNIDLVLKTAAPLDGLHGMLFASTDQHLLRKCPCPVWLRAPDSPRSVKTVLVALDVDEALAREPATLAGLNQRIVETAAQIGAVTGAAIHLLHVWDAGREGLVRLWSNAPDPEEAVASYVDDVQSAHWRALDHLVTQARGWIGPALCQKIKLVPTLERGTPRTVIPEQTRRLNADLLVMGTIARSGVSGFIIGNTAEDILNSVACSVVAVKPPSPVNHLKTTE